MLVVLAALLAGLATRPQANDEPLQNEPLARRAPGPLVPDFDEVAFATVGGQPLHYDLYLPDAGDGPFPVVVFIHGGGWTSGTHNSPARKFVDPLLAAGVAFCSVQYRLTSEAANWGGESVTFPAQIHDVKGAVRHLRANASTYGIDPERIGCLGTSAGAHLSALLATSGGVADLEGDAGGNLEFSSGVMVAATISAPTDLLNSQPDFTDPPGSSSNHDLPNSPESVLIGFNGPGEGLGALRANLDNPNPPYPQFVALARSASPNTHVDPNDPPMFVMHGEQDRTVAFKQSQRLVDALDSAGVEREFILDPDLGHVQTTPEIDAALAAFLIARLVPGEPAGPAGVVAR